MPEATSERAASRRRVLRTAVPAATAIVVVVAFSLAAFASPVVRSVAVVERYVPIALMAIGGVLIVSRSLGRKGHEDSPSEAPVGEPNRSSGMASAATSGLVVGFAVLAFLLPALHDWSRAESTSATVGGLLPWSDAEGYYNGAQRLLNDGYVDDWNERRPLNASFLAARLWSTGGDLRFALLLQSALAGIACLMAGRALALEHGTGSGIFLFGGLLLWSGSYLVSTLSEALGMTFGSLSFTALLVGNRRRSAGLVVAGFGVLALALCARSAAPFSVLGLLIWAGLALRTSRRFAWRTAVAGALVFLSVTLCINGALFALYGTGKNNVNGNFANTAYALAHGGGDWTLALRQIPGLAGMREEDGNGLMYAEAWREVRSHPTSLLRGLMVNGGVFWRDLRASVADLVSLRTLGNPGSLVVLWERVLAGPLAVVLLMILVADQRRGGRALGAMVVAVGLGVAASHPLLWVDGGSRALQPVGAYLIATVVVLVSRVASALLRRQDLPTQADVAETSDDPPPRLHGWAPVLFAAILAGCAIALPSVASAIRSPHLSALAAATESTCEGDISMVTRIGPRTPHISLVPAGETLVPRVAVETFEQHGAFTTTELSPSLREAVAKLEAPVALVLAYDHGRGNPTRWLIGRGDLVDPLNGLVQVCGRYWATPGAPRYRLIEVLSTQPLPGSHA